MKGPGHFARGKVFLRPRRSQLYARFREREDLIFRGSPHLGAELKYNAFYPSFN